MREIELKEMQQIELDILLAFDALCKKYDLRYYIDGGTLLGAMCYEGFIPWDDDIDLKMPRPDYERFILFANELPAHIHLEFPSKENCEYLFAKLTDVRTLLIENSAVGEKRCGIYVDIFPMDGYPDDERERELHLRRLSKLNTLFHSSLLHFSTMKHSHSWISRMKGLFYDTICTPFRLFQKLESLARKYDYEQCACVGLLIEGNPQKECFPKTWLEPVTELNFEGHLLPAPCEYQKHLRVFYGDHITNEEYYHNLPVIMPNHNHKVYWIDGENK